MSGRQHLTTKQLNNKTTRQQDNKTTRFVWKTIPSEARVTRDEVSGYMIQTKTAVWKTVPCIGWIPMLLVQSSRQLSFSFYNPETSSAGYSCFARLRQRPFPSLYKKGIKPKSVIRPQCSEILAIVLFPNIFYFLVGILPVFVT